MTTPATARSSLKKSTSSSFPMEVITVTGAVTRSACSNESLGSVSLKVCVNEAPVQMANSVRKNIIFFIVQVSFVLII